ncbi:MAG: hypothetical protein OXF65_03285 [Acidimicrobiaceae bacterium]|nr:hypothetical protein [Acidimicrobiaceae bacterium]
MRAPRPAGGEVRRRGRVLNGAISDWYRPQAGTTTGVRELAKRLSRATTALRRAAAATVACVVTASSLAVASLALTAPSAAAQSSPQLAPDQISVHGRGWGHGNGMSQWGALGYAVDHGWSGERIVSHFYGTTSHGPTSIVDVADSDIWVHLKRNDRRELLVTSGEGFAVADHAFDAGAVARIGVSNGSFWVRSTTGCAQRGSLVGDALSPTSRRGDRYIEAQPRSSDYTADDTSAMLTVIYCDPQSPEVEFMRVAYRGSVGIVDQGNPFTFNRLPLEQYLRGVVPHESPPSWGAAGGGLGIGALEAQAIAARSYALAHAVRYESIGRFTDICDTTACQVYAGAARNGQPLDHGTRFVHTNTAVANTAGRVVQQADDAIALTEFHASSGGWTAGLDEGSHFDGVEDLGDAVDSNERHAWQRKVRRADIEAAFPQIGKLVCAEVTKRNGNGAGGGRTRGVRLVGTAGVWEGAWTRWAGDAFRKAFSLLSDWYSFPQFEQSGPCPDGPVPEADPGGPATSPPDAPGLWLLKSDGTVLADGAAQHFGDGKRSSASTRFVDIAALPSGRGYWLVTAGGTVQARGDAVDHGDATAVEAHSSIVAAAAHPDGRGYWLATRDGAVFAFGAAGHWGGVAHLDLAVSVVDIEASPSGNGYWLALADGRVVAFGDAHDAGCLSTLSGGRAAVGLVAHPDGQGYWIAGADTAVYAVGSAQPLGSRAGLANRLEMVAIASTAGGSGYWLIWSDGTSFNRGDAPDYPTSRAGPGVVAAESVR